MTENKENRKTTRVPVISPEGKPLMPMKCSRVRKYIESGKAVGKRNKLGVFYVQLVNEPSGYNTQKISAGTDRGKCFTGIAAQSKNDTIVTFHIVLNGFYKSKRNTKDRQSVTGKMAKRTELRRTRRGQRINRKVPFKLRSHREKRFSNRKKGKIPPSVLANHLMALRVLKEMANILPLTEIVDEDCGGKSEKTGFGLSPVNVGQEWFREEAGKIAPIKLISSYNTGSYRNYLGLEKFKKDKSKQCRETHANDAIALCSSSFIEYKTWFSSTSHGHKWVGEVKITDSPFIVITRPKTFRRKLHNENYEKGHVKKRLGGTTTPFGFRMGDRVKGEKKGIDYVGYVGGYVDAKSKAISIYDYNWKRLGQFSVNKVQLMNRSSRLCISF